jgi:hypothetical protein
MESEKLSKKRKETISKKKKKPGPTEMGKRMQGIQNNQ